MSLLEAYRRVVTSQSGEDGVIERIFEIMAPANRWCMEVGAMDGMRLSNTYNLINNHGWSSVQIEISRKWFTRLKDRYKDNPAVHCLHGGVGSPRKSALDRILSFTPIPADFDLMSLDIDGNDYNVWKSMKKYRPRVVVIEFNDTMPDYVYFAQRKWSPTNQGSSLLALTELGKRKGYELVYANGINAIYVLKEYFGLFGIEDNSVSAMWKDRSRQTVVFQLFDGTLMMCGNNKYVWRRKFGKLKIIDGRTNEPIGRHTNKKRR